MVGARDGGSGGVYEFAVKNLRHPKGQWMPGILRIDAASSSSAILTWRPDSGGDDLELSVAFSAIQSKSDRQTDRQAGRQAGRHLFV